MRVGVHVSIAGGLDRAVDNAVALGCTAFQFFTRNPRIWAAKELVNEDVQTFKKKLAASKIDRYAVCVKMGYLPNLSAPDGDIYTQSSRTLTSEVERCGMLDVPYLVVRLGGHMGAGKEHGITNLITACNSAAQNVGNEVILLLQNTAGHKVSIGSSFEELGQILQKLEPRNRFGICLDTCNAFAAGYDLRTKDAIDDTIAAFEKHIGMKELLTVHLNDSYGELNSNIDRHEHIGLGKIGEKGFKGILAVDELRRRPLILETPVDERRDDLGNLEKVRQLGSSG